MDTTRNAILRRLPAAEFDLLAEHLRRVTLVNHQVLRERNVLSEDIYFIEHGVVALTASLDIGDLEVGLIGPDGLVGARGLLVPHLSSVDEAHVHIPGVAFRARSDIVRSLLKQLPTLDEQIRCYVVKRMDTLQQTSACNVLHNVTQRFARYLLVLSDRAETDEIPLTQESFAAALGVRRLSVNTAAQHLRDIGALRWGRGRILITDRQALEGASCRCYAALKDSERRLNCA